MKRLNWYDIIETQRIKIKEEDMQVVLDHINKEIEISYDEDIWHVYNEGGQYIADTIEIQED